MISNSFFSAERWSVRVTSGGPALGTGRALTRDPSRTATGSPAAGVGAALRLLLALSAGLAAIHLLGSGQLAAPPLSADSLSEWMRTGEPVLRAAAVGRMLALLIGSWAWLSLVAGLAVRAVGWRAGVRLLNRLSPQLVRSVLRTTATAALVGSVSISGPLGLSGVAAASSDTSADPGELVATMHWEPEVAGPPTTPGPATTTPPSSTPATTAGPLSTSTSILAPTSMSQSAATPATTNAPGAATTSSSASTVATADPADGFSGHLADSPVAPKPTTSGPAPAGALPASPPAVAVPGPTGPLTNSDQPAVAAPQSESTPAATDTSEPSPTAKWRVERGEHLWGIAASVVAQRTGTEPVVREVADYWLRLIDENRDRFVDPANPDLIHAGLVLTLPT